MNRPTCSRRRIPAGPATPSSWPPSSVHWLFLPPSPPPLSSLLPPPSNPPHRARQADHLTTSATATGPSPSNVKPAWNVALTTQTHGKRGSVGVRSGGRWRDEGSNWCPSRRGGRGEPGNYKNHLQCEWKSQWERLRRYWRLHPLPPSTLWDLFLAPRHLGFECAICGYRRDHHPPGDQCRGR